MHSVVFSTRLYDTHAIACALGGVGTQFAAECGASVHMIMVHDTRRRCLLQMRKCLNFYANFQYTALQRAASKHSDWMQAEREKKYNRVRIICVECSIKKEKLYTYICGDSLQTGCELASTYNRPC